MPIDSMKFFVYKAGPRLSFNRGAISPIYCDWINQSRSSRDNLGLPGRYGRHGGNGVFSFIDISREGLIFKLRIEAVSGAVPDFGTRAGILESQCHLAKKYAEGGTAFDFKNRDMTRVLKGGVRCSMSPAV